MIGPNRALRTLVLGIVLVIPGFLYAHIALSWDARDLVHVTGDEPHYLIIADAIATDHSLRVKDAYERDDRSAAIYGPINWVGHTRTGPAGTFSLHGIGLGALLSPSFGAFGLPGARMLLAAIAGLIPLLFYGIARRIGIDSWAAGGLSLSSAIALPFLAAAGQVFPDLPTGVLLLALSWATMIGRGDGASPRLLAGAGGLLAMLPWLHVKSVFPMMVFALAFVVLAMRGQAPNAAIRRSAWIVLPVLCSLGGLAWYNFAAFGHVTGPYAAADAGATLRQAAMIALGLHLDQAQGIFIQQPLFLLALAGLALFVRRMPFVASTLIAAYAAVLVPNAFHPCWYGCASISGRFMWSVAALWFFPLAVLFSELRLAERIGAAAVGGATILWQIALMREWGPHPSLLDTRMVDGLIDRNSLFAVNWRRYFPSFYDADRYLTWSTNVNAIALVLSLLAIGVWVVIRRAGRKPGVPKLILMPLLVPVGLVAFATVFMHPRTGASIDLLELFSSAELRPIGAGPETFALGTRIIDGENRRALFAHPPSRITWTLTVPPNVVFEAWIGLDSNAWPLEGDGVLFRMGVSDEYGYKERLSRHVNPHASSDDRRWIPVRVDLSPYGGRRVSIILNTNTGPPGTDDRRNDLAYWIRPRIHPN